MTEYWKVLNETHYQGHHVVYQACEKTARQILAEYVSNPDVWLSKAQEKDVESGRIYGDPLTHSLLEGVGRAKVSKKGNKILIGLGSGALLGGEDKCLVFTRTTKMGYDGLMALIQELGELEELSITNRWDTKADGSEMERRFVEPTDLPDYEEFLRAQQAEKELRYGLGSFSVKQLRWISPDHTMGRFMKTKRLSKKRLALYPLSAKNLKSVDTPMLDKKMLRHGLRVGGYKLSDIAVVYYSHFPIVHTVVMKDGEQFIVAPLISQDPPPCISMLSARVREATERKRREVRDSFHAMPDESDDVTGGGAPDGI